MSSVVGGADAWQLGLGGSPEAGRFLDHPIQGDYKLGGLCDD
jgi:hypothetical protein